MRRHSTRKVTLMLCAIGALSGCATQFDQKTGQLIGDAPTYEVSTPTLDTLRTLPPPPRPLYAAVYKFADQTGQQKPNENFAEYSRAVTQGGAAILATALHSARQWFTVVERESLQNLLQERQIVRATRQEFLGPDNRPLPPLPALLNAGIILDGGIIAYDSNFQTGGIGARFLGIGGDVQYRRDTVSVYLRAIAVQNGQVLTAVNANKTIYSIGVSAGVFKFVSLKKLLELEAGVTANEPVHLAVKQAIEKAIYAMVVQGAAEGAWSFADPAIQKRLVAEYYADRGGEIGVLPPGALGQPLEERLSSKGSDEKPKVIAERSEDTPSQSQP